MVLIGGIAVVAAAAYGLDARGPATTTSVVPQSSSQSESTSASRSKGGTPHSSTDRAQTATTSRPTTVPTTSPRGHTPFTIAFGGDVHFEGVIRPQLDANPDQALAPIAAMLQSADIAMVNLETAITTRGTKAPKEFNFRAPPTAFRALRGAGIDVVTMANNHGVDYGSVGLEDSIAAAASTSFPAVGIGHNEAEAYAPWRTVIRGERVSIIGATDVLDANLELSWTASATRGGLASAKRRDRLVAVIRAERIHADTLIVYLHWGAEMRSCPTNAQTNLARALVDAGADVIVGSHAHVLLGGGHLDNAYVDYGLGNFVFYTHGGITARSGVLTLTIMGRTTTASTWQPATIQRGIARPTPPGAATARALDAWTAARGCTGLAP